MESSTRRSNRLRLLEEDDPFPKFGNSDPFEFFLQKVPSVQRLTLGVLSPPSSPTRPIPILIPEFRNAFGKIPGYILSLPRQGHCNIQAKFCGHISSVAPSRECTPPQPEKKMGSPSNYTPQGTCKSMDALLHVISRISPAHQTEIPIQFTPVRTDFPEITSSIMSVQSSPANVEEIKAMVASAFASATMQMQDKETSIPTETKIEQLAESEQPNVRSDSPVLFCAFFAFPIFTGFPIHRIEYHHSSFLHSHNSLTRISHISHNVHD